MKRWRIWPPSWKSEKKAPRSGCFQTVDKVGILSSRTSDRCHWCGDPHPKSLKNTAFLKKNGLPRQCEHWLAMTCLGFVYTLKRLRAEPLPSQNSILKTQFSKLLYARAAPRALQASRASPSGASLQMTLSQASTAPAVLQSSSQERIHSPSPQP